jgi:Holliday junction DNA helicase RuvA
MIARITGILEQIDENGALIALPGAQDGTGIAHEILVPAYLGARLERQLGQLVTLHTIEHLEPQAQGASFVPRIIGFASAQERRFFALFTTVKGVGMRRALRALVMTPGEVAQAIAERDPKALVELPEIGKRLAETMIAELHGKVDAYLPAAASPSDARASSQIEPGRMASEPARRAIAALIRLGEHEREAQALVRRALEAEPSIASADELVAMALASR